MIREVTTMRYKLSLAALLAAALLILSSVASAREGFVHGFRGSENGPHWIRGGDHGHRYGYSKGYGILPGFWYLYEDDPCWVWTPEARVWVCH